MSRKKYAIIPLGDTTAQLRCQRVDGIYIVEFLVPTTAATAYRVIATVKWRAAELVKLIADAAVLPVGTPCALPFVGIQTFIGLPELRRIAGDPDINPKVKPTVALQKSEARHYPDLSRYLTSKVTLKCEECGEIVIRDCACGDPICPACREGGAS